MRGQTESERHLFRDDSPSGEGVLVVVSIATMGEGLGLAPGMGKTCGSQIQGQNNGGKNGAGQKWLLPCL